MKMTKRIIGISLLMVMLLMGASGCSKKLESSKPEGVTRGTAMDSAAEYGYKDSAMTNQASEVEVRQKKVIQTGDVRIVVEDLKKTLMDIRNKTDELGGYIESEGLTEYDGSARVRIPSQKLDDFMNYLDTKFDVEIKNTSSQDVTAVYIDNEARLKNFRAQEEQVLEILKKANTVDEVLKVQNELFRIRAEIESLEAKKKAWDRDVDFSTITLYARKKHTAIESKVKILSSNEFFKSISKGFSESTTQVILFIQNFVIFIISNIIMLVILGVLGFFGYRKLIKGRIKL
jgi:hypothetical protein